MSLIFGIGWFLIGVFWIIAGKPFIEVCACFLVCAVFDVSYQINAIRKEMEDWKEDE